MIPKIPFHRLKYLFMTETDGTWMRDALVLAQKAASCDEVPIGAVIISESGAFLASAYNQTITDNDPTAHAEILALRRAAAAVGNYRLNGATVYTTIEPCVMCAGALVNARVQRLVFGAHDERFGAVETIYRICDSDWLNHRVEITSGVLADECRELMQTFFREKRDRDRSIVQSDTST
jgi:tRNA(adenine34) deaminase